MFALVSRAFEILSDPDRRSAYDRGVIEGRALREAPPLSFEGFDFAQSAGAQRPGFRELFESVLSPEAAAAQRGEDVELTIRVSFDESFHGARRRLSVSRLAPCENCAGAGEIAKAPEPCATCGGSGSTRATRGHLVFRTRCRDCDGSGQRATATCPACQGDSRIPDTQLMDVDVPRGIEHGTRLRLSGAGNAGRRGAPSGDFVVLVEVDPHPVYRRAGNDLYADAPVSMIDAALGGHVSVQTPDGPVPIEIPAGTQHGQRFRLRKRGMPHFGDPASRGDFWAEVRIEIPAVTDDATRRVLRDAQKRLAKA